MWTVLTDDGHRINETREGRWPDLPADIRILNLSYRGRHGVYSLGGYQAYGFQRFTITTPAGETGRGAQIIGIKNGKAVVLEVDDVHGINDKRELPESELTYSRKLLRPGAG